MSRWQHAAACRSVDPELFFPLPSDHATEAAAKRVCHRCPVVIRCLEFALDGHLPDGIAGGLNPDERRALRAAVRAHTQEEVSVR